MKRKIYNITCTNGYTATRYAWNACIRHVEDVVREIARHEACAYTIVGSVSEKADEWHYVRGTRTWQSSDGRVLTFSIEEQGERGT